MRRAWIALLFFWPASVWATAYFTRQSGLWSTAADWSTSACGGGAAASAPTATDTAEICNNHAIEYDGAVDETIDVAKLTVDSGGMLHFGNRRTTLTVGGNGSGTAGGIVCAGTITVPAGSKILLDIDTADSGSPTNHSDRGIDKITMNSGCTLNLVGALLGQGKVAGITTDDGTQNIVFTMSGQVPAASAWNGKVLAFRSGRRKGAVFDITTQTVAGLITIDGGSHGNQQGLEPYATTGCTFSVNTVTCTGATFNTGTGPNVYAEAGDYFKFDADPATAANCRNGTGTASCCWTEIERRISGTQLQLKSNYACTGTGPAAGSVAHTGCRDGCAYAKDGSGNVRGAGPYQLRSQLILPVTSSTPIADNLYFQAMDTRLAPGDTFIVYDPAFLSVPASAKNDTNKMPHLTAFDGSSLYVRYADASWLEGGFECDGVDSGNTNEHFEIVDSELHDMIGIAAVTLRGACDRAIIARNYIHDGVTDVETSTGGDGCVNDGDSCRALNASNCCCGVTVTDHLDGVQFVDNHMARLNDPIEWCGGGTGVRFTGNIIHHYGKSFFEGGGNAMYFFDHFIAPTQTNTVSDFLIAQNWIYNGGRAISLEADVTTSDWGTPFELVLRDNAILNASSGAIRVNADASNDRAHGSEDNVSLINNYASSISGQCWQGPHRWYHNTCANSAIGNETNIANAPNAPQRASGNVWINWQGAPFQADTTFGVEHMKDAADMSYLSPIRVEDNVCWGDFAYCFHTIAPAAATIARLFDHNTVGSIRSGSSGGFVGEVNITPLFYTMRDNLFVQIVPFPTRAMFITTTSTADEHHNAFIGHATTGSSNKANFTVAASSLDVAGGLNSLALRGDWRWTQPAGQLKGFVTSDGTPVGARVAGTICDRLPVAVECYPFVNLIGDMDSDGDGIFDSFDNCKYVQNPTQVDANNNGIGDACDF